MFIIELSFKIGFKIGSKYTRKIHNDVTHLIFVGLCAKRKDISCRPVFIMVLVFELNVSLLMHFCFPEITV
jgi:hypothetical protein